MQTSKMRLLVLIMTCACVLTSSTRKKIETPFYQVTDYNKLLMKVTQTNDLREIEILEFVYDEQKRCVRIYEMHKNSDNGGGKVDTTTKMFFYRSNDKLPFKMSSRRMQDQEEDYYFKYDASGRKMQDSSVTFGRTRVKNYYYYDKLIVGEERSDPNQHPAIDSLYFDGKNISRIVRTAPYLTSPIIARFSYDDKISAYKNVNVVASMHVGFSSSTYAYLNRNNITKFDDGKMVIDFQYQYDADGFPTVQAYMLNLGFQIMVTTTYEYSK